MVHAIYIVKDLESGPRVESRENISQMRKEDVHSTMYQQMGIRGGSKPCRFLQISSSVTLSQLKDYDNSHPSFEI